MSNKNNSKETIARGLVKTLQHPELMEYLLDGGRRNQKLANKISKAIGPITSAETSVVVCVLEDVIETLKAIGYDPDIAALFRVRYSAEATIYSGTHEQCMETVGKVFGKREEDV